MAPATWTEPATPLRTEDQLISEMMSELAFKPRGKNVVEALTQAIQASRAAP